MVCAPVPRLLCTEARVVRVLREVATALEAMQQGCARIASGVAKVSCDAFPLPLTGLLRPSRQRAGGGSGGGGFARYMMLAVGVQGAMDRLDEAVHLAGSTLSLTGYGSGPA